MTLAYRNGAVMAVAVCSGRCEGPSETLEPSQYRRYNRKLRCGICSHQKLTMFGERLFQTFTTRSQKNVDRARTLPCFHSIWTTDQKL